MIILRKFFLLSYISIASVSATIITPAMPQMQRYFNLTGSSINFIITLFLLGYMFGQLFYGPIANRFGRMHALISGLWINIVGIVICLLGTYLRSYECLLFGRLITAIGAASGLCCTFMLIDVLLPEAEAKQAFSLSVLSFTLGIGLAILLGGLITQYGEWQQCFWLLLVYGVIMLASTLLFEDKVQVPQNINIRSIWSNYCSALKNKNLIIYASILGLCPMTSYTYAAAGPFIATQVLHLSPSGYGYWNLLNMVGMFSGSIVSIMTMKRYAMERVLKTAMLGMLLCLLSLWVMFYVKSDNALWFFSSIMFTYFTGSLIFPCASYLASHTIKDSASAASMMNFISISAGVLCVGFMGAVFDDHFRALNNTWLVYAIIIASAWGFRKKPL